MKIFEKVFAQIFDPLDSIGPDFLFDYAKDMQDNSMDNIEWAIAETMMRFARFRQMTQAIISEEELCEREEK
jgi:hypothetical protein